MSQILVINRVRVRVLGHRPHPPPLQFFWEFPLPGTGGVRHNSVSVSGFLYTSQYLIVSTVACN